MEASFYTLAIWLYIKLLALTYFCAFASLTTQILGLWGSQGIVPINKYVKEVKRKIERPYLSLPSIFLLNSSDKFMVGTAWAGVGLSILLLLKSDFFPIPNFLILAILWGLYYSFYNIGSLFLGFQWDSLLIEVGFISIFLAVSTPPPFLWLIVFWFLLFRFMFSSGMVKLLSGCPEWRSLKAMNYHYETQPLPTRVAWWAHHLPDKFHRLEVIAVLAIEIAIPFLIFFPDPLRIIAIVILIVFQLLIALTGNYAFFNLLTIALCVLPIENRYFIWLFGNNLPGLNYYEPWTVTNLVLSIVAIVFLLLNVLQLISLFVQLRSPWRRLLHEFNKFSLCNSYGLFACMTTVRDEIVVQGSHDGKVWQTYEFKWKPGDVNNPPKWVAPHQPRLDWQMWFAALGSYPHNSWLDGFVLRLMEGSKDVTKLLKLNPFEGNPPEYIRMLRYNYHFSDPITAKETGQWWTRTEKGPYSPIFHFEKVPQDIA